MDEMDYFKITYVAACLCVMIYVSLRKKNNKNKP